MLSHDEMAKEVEATGLKLDHDLGGNPFGAFLLPDGFGRWMLYLSDDGQYWGAYSDEQYIDEKPAKGLVMLFPGIRRGRKNDYKKFPCGNPQFVIDRARPAFLSVFTKIVPLLYEVA